MKKITSLVLLALTVAATILLTGCDPKKTGGGGQPQSYDSSTGRYN